MSREIDDFPAKKSYRELGIPPYLFACNKIKSRSTALQNALRTDKMNIVGSDKFTDNTTVLPHIKSVLI